MRQRIAIVGSGVMGRNHARTLRESIEDARISHVIDADLESARSAADEYGDELTIVTDSLANIDIESADAAIIASPSHLHPEQATTLMQNGLHVLVEKPIALNLEDGERMKNVAETTGRVLMAGHVELFNPVVQDLRSMLDGKSLRTVRFQRLGAVNDERRLKHEVVNDLMLHDLTIANQIVDPENREEPVVVSSYGRRDTLAAPDPAEAIVDYGCGIDAHFRASRAYAGGKVRKIEAETAESVFDADLLTRQITIRSAGEGVITSRGRLIQDVRSSLIFPQETREALLLEQLHFLKCIRGVATAAEAHVSADDAIRILRITGSILNRMILVK